MDIFWKHTIIVFVSSMFLELLLSRLKVMCNFLTAECHVIRKFYKFLFPHCLCYLLNKDKGNVNVKFMLEREYSIGL